MKTETRRYGACRAVLRLTSDGLAVLTVAGMITGEAIHEIRRDLARCRWMELATGLAMDFRLCTMLVTRGVLPLPPIPLSRHWRIMPAVLIVSPGDEAFADAHVLAQSQRGLVRAAFSNSADAYAWLADRVEATSSLWGELD